jgi:hypothetical protein
MCISPDAATNAVRLIDDALGTLATTPLNRRLRRHGWNTEAVDGMISYLTELRDRLATGWYPTKQGRVNMAQWFDDVGITLTEEDELKEAVRATAHAFNSLT